MLKFRKYECFICHKRLNLRWYDINNEINNKNLISIFQIKYKDDIAILLCHKCADKYVNMKILDDAIKEYRDKFIKKRQEIC